MELISKYQISSISALLHGLLYQINSINYNKVDNQNLETQLQTFYGGSLFKHFFERSCQICVQGAVPRESKYKHKR